MPNSVGGRWKTLANRVSLKSLVDQDVPDSVKDDLQALATRLAPRPRMFSGQQVQIGEAGEYEIYITVTTDTSSDGSNYHQFTCQRNGQVGVWKRGTTADLPATKDVEMEAYQPYYMGSINVGKHEMLDVRVDVYGSPSPMLTSSDVCILAMERI